MTIFFIPYIGGMDEVFLYDRALSEDELYLNKHRELGLSHYDTHADGSGVVYVSEKRPILNMRPGLYTFNYINDTHILKCLELKKFEYDLTTDYELTVKTVDLGSLAYNTEIKVSNVNYKVRSARKIEDGTLSVISLMKV